MEKNFSKCLMLFIAIIFFGNDSFSQCVCPGGFGVQFIEPFTLPTCGNTNGDFPIYVHFGGLNTGSTRTVHATNLPTGWVLNGIVDEGDTYYTSGGVNYASRRYKFRFNIPVSSPSQYIGFYEILDCYGPCPPASSEIYNRYMTRLPVKPTVFGDNIVCTSKTFSGYHPAIGSGSLNWTTGSGLSVASGQGTNSVQISNSGSGTSYVKLILSQDACGNNNVASDNKDVWRGVPSITSQGQYQFDTYTQHLYIGTPSGQIASYNWSVTSGDPTLNQNYGPAVYATSYAGGTVTSTASNECGTGTSAYFTVPPGGSFLRAYPNPATDVLTMELKNAESMESLPASVDLYSESSTQKVKSVSIQEVSKNNAFRDRNKIELGVSDLPRGIYYLHINPNDKQKQEVQKVRIRLD